MLKLETPTAGPVPGATRLRELATDLFIPVDAELVPSLLDDEAAGLVRDGGLVLLPGGPVLRFDREATLGLEALLAAPSAPSPRVAADARAPPARRAGRRGRAAMARAAAGRPLPRVGAGTPAARRSRPASRAAGWDPARVKPTHGEASARPEGAGDRLRRRRRRPGLQGLGDALRDLIGRAGAGARSLGEKIQWGMTDHSALVQKLLREFRHGDPGRALRHAFSMTPADPRDRNGVVG